MSFDWGRGGAAQQIRAKEGQDTYLTDGDGDSFLALSLSNNLYFILIRGAEHREYEVFICATHQELNQPFLSLIVKLLKCLCLGLLTMHAV